MTVMRTMKMAAAPLPQNINIGRKREKRKRKRKKRRRRKRGSINHPNLMTSQSLTDSSHLLHGHWPLYLWTARKDPKNEEENTRKGFIKLRTYMCMHTASYTGMFFCPSAVRKKKAALNHIFMLYNPCWESSSLVRWDLCIAARDQQQKVVTTEESPTNLQH